MLHASGERQCALCGSGRMLRIDTRVAGDMMLPYPWEPAKKQVTGQTTKQGNFPADLPAIRQLARLSYRRIMQ